MNVFRLKSNLLKNQDNRWFLQNQPYTGIVFFDKDNFQLDVFEVESGYVTKPYISPCQKTLTGILPSPISIDSSSFSNEEEDVYGCGTILQMYQNSIYQGMSYDRYNWDGGKSVTILGQKIADDQLGAMHRAGMAKEYNMYGAVPLTITWSKDDPKPKITINKSKLR